MTKPMTCREAFDAHKHNTVIVPWEEWQAAWQASRENLGRI